MTLNVKLSSHLRLDMELHLEVEPLTSYLSVQHQQQHHLPLSTIINTANTNGKKTLTGTTPTTIPSTQSSSTIIYTVINTNFKKTLTALLSSTVQTTKDKSLKTEIITGTVVAVFSCVVILIFLLILKRKNILCGIFCETDCKKK